MRVRLIAVVAFLLFLDNLPSRAQIDSLSFHTDLYFLSANQNFQPQWQISNRYGIFDKSKQNEFLGLFGLAYQTKFGKKFKLEAEIEFNLKSEISTSYFQQVYFNFYYRSLQFKIGKEAYTISQYSEDLSSGSFFLSNNARPLPRIGIGFYNYTPVPLIDNYLEFKGLINFGIFNDDRSEFNGTNQPMFHEKILYFRSKGLPLNIHAGLNHSAQFGGTLPNGRKIETDLIATFLGKSGGEEETNVAGAHFGLYDIGANWKYRIHTFQFYFQKPFSDGSGKNLRSKDKIVGLLYYSSKMGIITSINYEYINTTHQTGKGTPDPIVNGKLIIPYQIEDFDKYMLENFDTVTVGMTSKEFSKYLSDKYNYGYVFGGRDDHYNNGLYNMGLSYQNQSIGTSLFLTKQTMKLIDSDFNGLYDLFFVSNRIIAHHLAFDGFFNNNFSYRTKLTYSINHGSYAGANKGRYNWASIEDPEYYNSYYFKDGLKQAYTFFEVKFTPFKDKGAQFSSSIAYDFGEMYHNFGVLFGFHYHGFFKLKNTSKSKH